MLAQHQLTHVSVLAVFSYMVIIIIILSNHWVIFPSLLSHYNSWVISIRFGPRSWRERRPEICVLNLLLMCSDKWCRWYRLVRIWYFWTNEARLRRRPYEFCRISKKGAINKGENTLIWIIFRSNQCWKHLTDIVKYLFQMTVITNKLTRVIL